ncbi:E3 ubiquitin-protein ligase mbr2 [Phtheirospermum japonicum]|uniref:RING-type E3 ubiquitin transferase n=1 Tax=Phtheirospermum japonicum TaxID=374723 RepID=A0A830BCU0_9LAMI|nr:E3 ubiquitin-protein ligase mbr2 [Phtheirospermum japonicum]
MQGHKSSMTTLPENLSFDHGSTSSDAGIDSQMPWNSIPTSTHNRLPESLNAGWTLGETSSNAAHTQGENNSERKREHAWSVRSRSALALDEHRIEPSNIFTPDNIDVNANINQTPNMLDFVDHEDDACQIIERPDTFAPIRPSNEQIPSIGNSSYSPSESGEDGPGFSLDGRRVSCKRKSLEVHAGQSSGAGSSNYFQHSERSNIPIENRPVTNNGPEQANPRLRLGVGGTLLANPFSSTTRSTSETSRRNFRLRINGSRQQDHHHVPVNPFLPEVDPVNTDTPSSQNPPGLVLRNHFFDLNPPPAAENRSLLHVPSARRNSQSRWAGGPSSSRMSNSSMLYEESTPRNIPRSISEHPMFVPASEIGSSSQQPPNRNLAVDNNNIGSSSRAGSDSGITNSSGPSWANQSRPQYSRRLSEIVRRSLLSTAGIESPGSQSSGQAVRLSSSQGTGISSGRHLSSSRSERQHVDGAFGVPYSMRSLAAAGEGRTSMMSEIRHVLDLMRRGEGLRFEDVMILDHSVLFGMADIHDRHRDMRLDVDNMSYEELLALEERIGNVCTGLNEETIMSRLKQHKYIKTGTENEAETEPCSICREEYTDGENLGTLECGHDFHRDLEIVSLSRFRVVKQVVVAADGVDGEWLCARARE